MLLLEMSETPSAVVPPTSRLLGRGSEREMLHRLLGGARDGQGAVLVLHGEAGVGKTVLLDDAAKAAADDFRVARISGVEGEMELPVRGPSATMFALARPLRRGCRGPSARRSPWRSAQATAHRQPFLVGTRRPRPALRSGSEATPPLHRGRRPVARSRLNASAPVCRPPPVWRSGSRSCSHPPSDGPASPPPRASSCRSAQPRCSGTFSFPSCLLAWMSPCSSGS